MHCLQLRYLKNYTQFACTPLNKNNKVELKQNINPWNQ